jgi:hypothetical protein
MREGALAPLDVQNGQISRIYSYYHLGEKPVL